MVLLVALAAVTIIIQSRKPETPTQPTAPANTAVIQPSSALRTMSPMDRGSLHVPAHYEVPPAAADLRPVLPSSQFAGKTREAYEAVKQIEALMAFRLQKEEGLSAAQIRERIVAEFSEQ
jgi:hypothetical protein